MIKKDKKTIPNALKLDFRLRTCFVAIISDAKIQNWVKNIIGIANSGVTAKNLSKPGEWAYPTATSIFLNVTFDSLSENNLTPTT